MAEEAASELLYPVRLARVDFLHHTANCKYYGRMTLVTL